MEDIIKQLPEQFKGKKMSCVLVSYTYDNKTIYNAITNGHYGLKGNGKTPQDALDDLRTTIACSIEYDMDNGDPIHFNPTYLNKSEQFTGYVASFIRLLKTCVDDEQSVITTFYELDEFS